MTRTEEQEYRRLELESSNLLMERDGRRALGQYAESALATRRAAELRERMGQLRQQSGQFVEAVEDWLSASACYLQADGLADAQAVVHKLEELEHRGCIPVQRADLLALLQRRKQEVREFNKKNCLPAGMEPSSGCATVPAEAMQKKDG
jgi:hypothetical protein